MAFSLLVIMLQTNSSLSFSLLPKVNQKKILWEKSTTLVIFNIQNHLNCPSVNNIHVLRKENYSEYMAGA